MTKIQKEALMSELWLEECHNFLVWLKLSILKGPMLARPEPRRRLYLNTDWSKDVMGDVLLQADESPEAKAAKKREVEGEALQVR